MYYLMYRRWFSSAYWLELALTKKLIYKSFQAENILFFLCALVVTPSPPGGGGGGGHDCCDRSVNTLRGAVPLRYQ